MEPTILAYPKSNTNTNNITAWSYTKNSEKSDFVYEETQLYNNQVNCNPVHPHSNAFVDLNGDCMADIFMVCQETAGLSFQIWVNDENGFSLAMQQTLPKGIGQITFGDMGISI